MTAHPTSLAASLSASASTSVSDFAAAHPALAAGVRRGPDRLLLHVLFGVGVLLLFFAAVAGMRRGWRRRATTQEDVPDLLGPPTDAGIALAAPLKGLYLGTVDAGHWLDRITTQGLGGRADGYVGVYEAGIRVDRSGAEPFWIPREAVRGARLERAHAGKVAGPGRIVVVAWSFGGRELETGFRGSDRPRQPKIVRAVHELLGPAPARVLDGETTSPQPIVRALTRLRRHPVAGSGAGQIPGAQIPGAQIPGAQIPGAQGLGAQASGARIPVAPPMSARRPAAPAAAPSTDPTPMPLTAAGGPGAAQLPATAASPTGAARRPRPVPAPIQAHAPAHSQAHTQPHAQAPTQPHVLPAAAGSAPGEVGDVDPLTSPLGDVVRRMRETP